MEQYDPKFDPKLKTRVCKLNMPERSYSRELYRDDKKEIVVTLEGTGSVTLWDKNKRNVLFDFEIIN